MKKKACPIEPDVFANFLEELYKSDNIGSIIHVNILRSIPEFTVEEMTIALGQLSNLRCGDDHGIVAEMLKAASLTMHEQNCACFNQFLHRGFFDESWYVSIFQMLPKSGPLNDAGNWRPIAILPIMYKLFSRMLYNWLGPQLHGNQSND